MSKHVERLLAKSCRDADHPPAEATLRGHTMLVCEAADELLAARGIASLRAAGLPLCMLSRLERIVRLAAFEHDLGKSSEQFQNVVRGDRSVAQLIRHEAASLWLCWPGQPLAMWLRPSVERDADAMIAAVAAAGHHRKFWSRAVRTDGAGAQVALLTDHDDFIGLLEAGARRLGLKMAPLAERHVIELGRRNRLIRSFEEWEEEWLELARVEPEAGELARVAKALVLAADVAGSSLAREHVGMTWIRGELARRASAEEFRSVANVRLGSHAPRPFQLEVASSTAPVTFVRAGCGSGKTVAAYLWAAQYAARQLWVTYPTTGTTTEGYRDYVAEHPDLFARLEHGRREVDLEVFDLDRRTGDARQRTRLEALGTWGAKVVVCTVDTVLGLVQNHRKGLYAWPAIAESAVVFDEIHAYDDHLFGSLLRFLEAMPGLPVLLMTASLPSQRLDALRALVERLHNRALAEVPGPVELERLDRYVRVDTEPVEAAHACLASGGKVLWVSNTVGRCMRAAEFLPSALVYHSRFRYRDRIQAHRRVIAAFGAPGAAIATTTQVAEMSLDLSADLLVTEHASVPAMIQRLGRLNRRAVPGAPRVCPFVVVPVSVERPEPYSTDELAATERWLERLGFGELSQADLAEAWDAEPHEPGVTAVSSTWADGGYSTEIGDLREPTSGLTVLLEDDADAVRRDPRLATQLALPMRMPRNDAWKLWRQVAYLPVAPATALSYDPQRGGRWQ